MGFSRQEYWSGFCHFLLQGIFPTQGLNLGFSHCRQIFHRLSHQGSSSYSSMNNHHLGATKCLCFESFCRKADYPEVAVLWGQVLTPPPSQQLWDEPSQPQHQMSELMRVPKILSHCVTPSFCVFPAKALNLWSKGKLAPWCPFQILDAWNPWS